MNTNIIFNANSFSEMSKKVVFHYFDLINKKLKPNFIFHQNSNVDLFPNSKRHIEIQSSNFPIDKKNYTKIFSNVGMIPAVIAGLNEKEIHAGALEQINNTNSEDFIKIALFFKFQNIIKDLSSSVVMTVIEPG